MRTHNGDGQLMTAANLWHTFRSIQQSRSTTINVQMSAQYVALEQEIRNLLSSYCYACASRNVQWLSSLFVQDVMLFEPADVHVGMDRVTIRLIGEWSDQIAYKRLTNFVVNQVSAHQALISCYVDKVDGSERSAEISFGRALYCATFLDGAWRISALREQLDFSYSYASASVGSPSLDLADPPQAVNEARAWAPRRTPDFEGGRATWHELRDDVWAAHRWLLEQPEPELTADQKLRRLAADIRIRELLANYAYAHDSLDVEWSGLLFTADAMLINEKRVFEGNDQVIEAFRGWNRGREGSFHRFSNVQTRLTSAGLEAWVIAYFHVVDARTSLRQSSFGRYFGRAVETEEGWRISDWRIANDSRYRLPLTTGEESGE